MDSDKIHSIKYEYDKWGNDVLRTFFNADGPM